MINHIRKQIPNCLTVCNVLCGSIATVMALRGELTGAAIAILVGALFDFADGFAARLLNAHSAIGKELDSLADVITFGLAPSMLLYVHLNNLSAGAWWSYGAFLMVGFSAYRLAKFNLDERQTKNFIGMPTPANALFWIGITIPSYRQGLYELMPAWALMALMVITSLLLVSEIPMYSLKFSSSRWTENRNRYILLVIAVGSIGSFGWGGFTVTILFYIISNILFQQVHTKKKIPPTEQS